MPSATRAETLIGTLGDAERYNTKPSMQPLSPITKQQSAVERELVLRLASLPWRLRWATTMETGPFQIQTDQFRWDP